MKPFISVEKLRLKFPKEEGLLFKDLDLSIQKGEKVLLLGPSGCGKSTLLQVLAGIIPNSVEVPMKAEKLDLPTRTGYVFQDPDSQFCMPYVDEEIAFVLENLQVPREEMPEKIAYYLKNVGLEFEENHVKIGSLSGGQKQRLAIASILALQPEVLFLDEPTAMLDPEGTQSVWETIKELMDDKTLIIVEHKIDHVVKLIDRVIVFNHQGEIIANGNKEEVLKSHLPLLKEHGIWYPGVWNDYLSQNNQTKPVLPNDEEPIARLRDFGVYRKKTKLASVQAVDIFPGEWITIVGENGAGKSTLLLGLMQLLKTSGSYELYGNQVNKKTDLSMKIAYVFQNPEFQFVTHSVYDEMAHALRLEKKSEQVIENDTTAMLDLFSLLEHQQKHPYQLSMGQKRRLSVASSMMQKQSILLLDEPTFGQDSRNTFALLELLEQERQRGTTIIMVTHDEEIVNNFSTRIWMISKGRLIDDSCANSKESRLLVRI
jgi:energy-coupling factor transporter ATP-binding protein EcfA2